MTGRRIGPYTLLERLGGGGMGEVYLARQEGPIRRQVALKVVKPGMDSAEVLRRFERERQTLARLSHPHIAAVLDAGATEEGRPYLVMEYVAGETLLAYCARARPDIAARLELFRQICAAIEHAHHKGIVHRDLKPANVLVTLQATAPTCRVIDFGIAKMLFADGAEPGGMTLPGEFVGTPEYMSPEQLGGAGDVDTRADVYSLGVILYELLTGARPLADALSRAPGILERQRIVRDVEPARPSTRAPNVRGDLDWICLTALEKDRARRYGSPAALWDDLQRFLDHEPVIARPPTAGYRLRKFVRRHRGPVIGAGVAALTLLVGLATTAGLLASARRAGEAEARLSANLRELSDLHLLREAERKADGLWPALPSRLGALRAWLATDAAPLAARREHHLTRLAALQADLARRGTAREPVPREQQFEHDALAELTAELDRFLASDPHDGVVGSVRARVETAERLALSAKGSDYFAAWRNAATAIEASARYDGLTLAPQPDLWPLGENPGTGLFEFWHVPSGARPSLDPEAPPRTRWRITGDTGLVFVLLPPATFRIGVDTLDIHTPPKIFDEVILSAFFVSKYEMTQGQWLRITGRNPSRLTEGGPAHPVENVSWYDCTETLRRLGLALPTDAQWEYAARAHTETPWWCGASAADLTGCANIADRTLHEAGGQRGYVCTLEVDDGFVQHAPVGSLRPNGFGLHDVAGNLYEWCRDSYGSYGWFRRPGDGLSSDRASLGNMRFDRGGSWRRPALQAASSERDFFPARTRVDYLGVRPARGLRVD